jgi:hypothetical protein
MIVKRRYYDIMENEEWLNEMAQDGHAMNDCSAGLFTDVFSFEKCEQGEYIFRVLMLDNNVKHPESMRYLRFLRESGVEHIGSNGNAVYLRKKADSDSFDIFTDRDSRLKYHSKMTRLYLWSLLAYPVILAIAVGIMALGLWLNISSEWWYLGTGLVGGVSIGLLLTLNIFSKCFQALRHHRKVVKRLKN